MNLLYQQLYTITLHEPISNKEETNQAFLYKREYKNMSKRINEIVYVDEDNKEWALKSIAPNDRRTT